jgi:hypothetical protein
MQYRSLPLFPSCLPLFEKNNASAVPVSIDPHQTLGKTGVSCKRSLCRKIQRHLTPAHEIGYRLQFVQKIVYNLDVILIANSD